MRRNNIDFAKTEWEEQRKFIKDFYEEFGYKNDSFHNDMLFGGQPYSILLNGEVSGFVSVGDGSGGRMLKGFYLEKNKRNAVFEVFRKMLENFKIRKALVVSNDSISIAHSFERMNRFGGDFIMQAYNFTYGEPDRPAEYGMECLEEVKPEEYEKMNSLTERQWEGCFGNDGFRFFKIVSEGEVLGYGALCTLKYNDVNIDIGNYTLPQHRRKGVGRSMIINIARKVKDEGFAPVAGCWYENKESVMTLTSAGFHPENRIFLISFK